MTEKTKKDKQFTCGIIMPISLIDNCSPEHWADVLGILKDVCITNNFIPNLVSDADDIGVIHNRIIENIYSSDIVICDVSCKNANVMFELGMRLAFDKPTIIIKDDLTGYSFDTSLIEHLEYPRDLRFTSINKFKDSLGKKLIATFEKSKSDPNYSTFLKNFGKYKIAHLEDREVSTDTFILNAIEELRRDVRIIKNVSLHERGDNVRVNLGRSINSHELTEEARTIFKKNVHDYIKKNNLMAKPSEMDIMLPDIIEELEKNEELKLIAGNSNNFRRLVRDSIYA
ncbi:RNA helicase [Pedobacter hiemivivus]|uniref:RNA helicase n=1 Tax=Pedobacter hiemivivus TaxID=2530454 RepID=A0A4U1G230_9SPHI|nr:RNA helicase [Pedobacter hiemivivus]TKC57615.1 RNA helicase [Pedobacter hiemivivus]